MITLIFKVVGAAYPGPCVEELDMHSTDFIVRYARDYLKQAHDEARIARLRPSYRSRLSGMLYALAERLEPGVTGRYAVRLLEERV
jgi:DNA-binding transcriptional MocR family regulator